MMIPQTPTPAAWRAPLAALLLLVGGCAPPTETALPRPDELAAYYADSSIETVEMRGNVALVTVEQDATHLRRGGRLWAKMGPYIHIFSPATEELLRDFPAVAGVRVRTVTISGTEIASVLLERTTLNDITWKGARTRVAQALTHRGAEQVRSIEQLVEYGERRTTYEYNPDFTRR
ncbi:MAG: hypothetical protein RQ745_00355 [Longimicrobiales bacterium]|nr:hypothetical protein [Longimicrobiales bacterium]